MKLQTSKAHGNRITISFDNSAFQKQVPSHLFDEAETKYSVDTDEELTRLAASVDDYSKYFLL